MEHRVGEDAVLFASVGVCWLCYTCMLRWVFHLKDSVQDIMTYFVHLAKCMLLMLKWDE